MTTPAHDVSKLTGRCQTTVPSGARRHLKLGKGDRIHYCTEPDDGVHIEPANTEEVGPTLGAFLDFVEADIMSAHPDVFARSTAPCMTASRRLSAKLM